MRLVPLLVPAVFPAVVENLHRYSSWGTVWTLITYVDVFNRKRKSNKHIEFENLFKTVLKNAVAMKQKTSPIVLNVL